MITSNLSEAYINVYMSYISTRYEHLWNALNVGNKVVPVIGVANINNLFRINVPSDLFKSAIRQQGAFSFQCDLKEPYITLDQLQRVALTYRLTDRKTFIDLKVAHNLFLYNMYRSDNLVLLVEDMYNAAQFHNEFYMSVISYFKEKKQHQELDRNINLSIDTNPENGICYKEVMDYLHYDGMKPNISFHISSGKKVIQASINASDFEAQFTEYSYNIILHNINIL